MGFHDDPLLDDERSGAADGDSLWELWDVAWASRWLIVLSAVVSAACAAAWAWSQPSWYRARVVMLAEQPSVAAGGASAPAARDAAVHRLFPSAQVPLATLQSERFAQDFIERRELVEVLLADEWDVASQSWKGAASNETPDVRDAVEVFLADVLEVQTDPFDGLTTLTVSWRDPVLAAQWAQALVEDLEASLRAEVLADAERRIEHLKGELASTRVGSVQRSLDALLEHELQRAMLAKASPQVAFRVIDPATAPKRPFRPNVPKVVGVAAALGAMAGLAAALLRRSARARRERLAAETRREQGELEPHEAQPLSSVLVHPKRREVH